MKADLCRQAFYRIGRTCCTAELGITEKQRAYSSNPNFKN